MILWEKWGITLVFLFYSFVHKITPERFAWKDKENLVGFAVRFHCEVSL